MKKLLSILIAMLLLAVRPALAMVVSNFDNGLCNGPGVNEQCWSLNSNTGFELANPTSGGHPNGYAQLMDTRSGIGGFGAATGGLAVAPTDFLGNLTGYASISWDAMLPSHYASYKGIEPVILVISSNMTDYSYLLNYSSGVAGAWQHWEAPLDVDTGWTCTSSSCSTPFADVVANVTRLAFDLEVTSGSSSYFASGIEAGLDNVKLNPIPVPAAVWLFGSGLLGLAGVARRRKS